jgi:phage shock protein C
MTNRLHRSRSNVMLGGVCAGLAEYFGIDPTLVRLFFVIFTLVNGVGVLGYLVLWLILPAEGSESAEAFGESIRAGADEIADRARSIGDDVRDFAGRRDRQTGLFVGIALLLVGLVFLLRNMGVTLFSWLSSDLIWPALLVLAGVWILVSRIRAD